MERQFAKFSDEWMLFKDYYIYIQKCYEPKTDEEWEQLVREGDRLIKKYNSSEYVLDLVKVHIADCERRADGKKKM